jgi:predicted TIM-barrel fold metal-dependent hydrolase
MHVHLFATQAGGSYLSPEQKRHVNYRYFLALLRLHEGPRMDEEYVERLVAQVRGSSVKRVVLVAQDCRYDGGRPDLGRTSFFVPNDYLFEVVARHPDVFVPCVSINPRRADAVEELERCAAKGARVLKIHPPIQDVDPGDPAFRRFYRRCSELGVVVMVHTGTEKAAATVGDELSRADRLVLALEEGCTVIAAHSCMSSFFEKEDFFPGLVETVRRHPRLYCDTSNLASMLRWRNLPRALAVREVRERLVYGSDFPFPANALVFWSRLRPRTTLRLLSLRNLVERSYRLQLALGLPQEALTRGATLIGA